MSAYMNYIDSGIQWVGKVPSSWQRSRIKYLLTRSSAGVWGEDEKGDQNDVVCIRIADFNYQQGNLCLDNLTIRNIDSKQLAGRVLSEGDLIIEKSGGGDVSPVGRVVRYSGTGLKRATYSNFSHAISVNQEKCNPEFLYYYFFALYANKINLQFFNQTTGIQNLSVSDYLSQSIFLPNLSEQAAIVKYLNRKCSEISNVIETQEKIINYLKELQHNIITEATIHGVYGKREMTQSKVNWIGYYPANWEFKKFNYVCSLITDFVASGSFADLRENVHYLTEPDYAMLVRTVDLSEKGKEDSKVYISKESYDFLRNSNLYGGEVILPNVGSVGSVYMMPYNLYPHMSLAPNAIMFRTKYNNKFYYYFFKGFVGNKILTDLAQATTLAKFNKTDLRAVKVFVPPIEEQNTIVAYLDEKCEPIDKAIDNVQHQIDTLKEYKQSLITEVITGKRKVI